MAEFKCDIWANVDFGDGVVAIRCTQTCEHKKHRCVVDINIPEPVVHADPEPRSNVFDSNTDVPEGVTSATNPLRPPYRTFS